MPLQENSWWRRDIRLPIEAERALVSGAESFTGKTGTKNERPVSSQKRMATIP